MRQNGGQLQNILRLLYWISDNVRFIILQGMSFSARNKTFISIQSKLFLHMNSTYIPWYTISPQSVICTQHTQFTFKSIVQFIGLCLTSKCTCPIVQMHDLCLLKLLCLPCLLQLQLHAYLQSTMATCNQLWLPIVYSGYLQSTMVTCILL